MDFTTHPGGNGKDVKMDIIKIGLPYLDVFNLINGIGGWKQRYKLDIKYHLSMNDISKEWGWGGIIWRGTNFNVVLVSNGEETSCIDVHVDDDKSSVMDAQKTWAMLDYLFSRYVVVQPAKDNIDNPKNMKNLIEQVLEKDHITKQIYELIKTDPTLTDSQIAQKINLNRGNVNKRRRFLEDLGCKVREPKTKNKKMSRQKKKL